MLSILVCHLPSREEEIGNLVRVLAPQVEAYPTDVEVIVNATEGITVGEKRNRLVRDSAGDYVAFIDDDDLVADNYVSLILTATESKPDCCSLLGEYRSNGVYQGIFEHSILHLAWQTVESEREPDIKWVRPPNHLNAIRRDLVLQVPFADKSFGEDKDFSDQIRPLLKTEVEIPQLIYTYLHRSK